MIVGIGGRTSSSSWGKEFGLSACFHKSARNALKAPGPRISGILGSPAVSLGAVPLAM